MNTTRSASGLHLALVGLLKGLALSFCLAVGVQAAIVSDGSLGALSLPSAGTVTLNMNDLAPDGVFNYTTISIPASATLRFQRNAANTPVYLAATGSVNIQGTIQISAAGVTGGPGGGNGGAAGSGTGSGLPGQGPSPGADGLGSTGLGNAGGGGGMATPGLMATSRTGANPAPGGPQIAPPHPFEGGSGGGGGGGRNQCIGGCVALTGGPGGGGGGGIQIWTPADIVLDGRILANGAKGGNGFSNIFGFAGPGGGGSGGNVQLHAQSIVMTDNALIEALGGYGGGLSTEPVSQDPEFYASGATGGMGYVSFDAGTLDLRGTVGASVVPLQPALPLLGSTLAGLAILARRRSAAPQDRRGPGRRAPSP